MNLRQLFLVFLAAVLVMTVAKMLRRRQASAEREHDPNVAVPIVAEEAVRWAAAKGVTLDYSPESVERVEPLLAELHERHAKGDLPRDDVVKYAVRYGAYIGEVIRRRHNGRWAVDHDVAGPGSFPIRWGDGQESFPVGWCGKRIINGEEDNVWFKFRMIVLDEGVAIKNLAEEQPPPEEQPAAE